MRKLFTSESITVGHPDRLCDTIANTLLTRMLEQDPNTRAGLEALATKNKLVLSGEVTTKAIINADAIAREVIKEIGYNRDSYGFNHESVEITNLISSQSPDIAMGVDREGEIGAGDQGIIFGYATNETSSYLPYAAHLANALTTRYQEVQKESGILRPDGKSQVTIDYTNGVIDTIVIAASHNDNVSKYEVEEFVKENIIKPVLEANRDSIPFAERVYNIIINGTGRFVVCGPESDCGVVGRKLVVDSYGGYAKIGGGCTNGKDPSKVDASSARASRHAAKNLVAAGIADIVEIQLSYAIGIAQPVSIVVDTFGTNHTNLSEAGLAEFLSSNYDFSPKGMIDNLHLDKADYSNITYTGQFGSESYEKDGKYFYPWEELNLAENFKKLIFG